MCNARTGTACLNTKERERNEKKAKKAKKAKKDKYPWIFLVKPLLGGSLFLRALVFITVFLLFLYLDFFYLVFFSLLYLVFFSFLLSGGARV